MHYLNQDIDLRTINGKPTEEQQKVLKDIFDCIIQESTDKISEMKETWDMAALYKAGKQVPLGRDMNVMQLYEKINKIDGVEYDKKKNKLFYVNNKIGEVCDSTTGRYMQMRKKINVSAGSLTKFKSMARKWERFISYMDRHIAGIDDDDYEDMWMDYRIPCINYMITYGFCLSYENFNPFRKLKETGGAGAIEVETISPYEALIDPMGAKKHYFKSSRYMGRRKLVEVNEAREYLSRFGIDPGKVDSDAEIAFEDEKLNMKAEKKQYVTLYFIEPRRMYYGKKGAGDSYKDFETPEQYKQDGTGEFPEVEEQKNCYFKAIYNKNLGCIVFGKNELGQFRYTPWINKESDLRLHPIGEPERLKPYNDILNITTSKYIDDVRTAGIIRGFIAKKLVEEYGQETVDAFMEGGGILPVDSGTMANIKDHVSFLDVPNVDPEIKNLYQMFVEDIERQGYRTNPNDGNYPTQRLAENTVKTLIAQSEIPMTEKEIHINWAATKETQLMIKMAKKYYNEEQMIKILKENPNSPSYIPYNALRSYPEYLEMVQQFGMTVEKFEEENDVDYLIPKVMPTNYSIPPEAMMQQWRVAINRVDPDDDISVQVELDPDYDNKKEMVRQGIQFLFQQPNVGMAVIEELLEVLELEDKKEKIMSNINSNNIAMAIMNKIQMMGDDPNVIQDVMSVIDTHMQARMQQSIQKAGKGKQLPGLTPASYGNNSQNLNISAA